MSPHPDWGHGPNPPVSVFSEDEIRKVMEEHRPVAEGDCLCAWRIHAVNRSQDFTVDHLIEQLKEARG